MNTKFSLQGSSLKFAYFDPPVALPLIILEISKSRFVIEHVRRMKLSNFGQESVV